MGRRHGDICAIACIAALASACYTGLDGRAGADGGDGGDDSGDVPLSCEDGELDPGPNLVRRLTVPEYVASIRAVIGIDVGDDARALIPADLRADGFSNTAAGLISSADHVEAYAVLAEQVSNGIADIDGFVARYTDCSEFGETCERPFVENLGLELFRSPVRAEEVDLIVPLFALAQSEGEDFEAGARLVVETMLQSPRFLFRIEDERGDGSVRALEGFDMANRLSFLVWGAPPDDVLLDAARNDELRTEEQIEAQVRRMLDDPRVREASVLFMDDWAHLARLEGLTRDPERFPSWTAAIGLAMQDETRAFFEEVIWDEAKPVGDLFNTQKTFVSPDLADHYGIPAPEGATGEVDLSTVVERGGILTHGSLLTLGGNDSSMVSRGKFILETFVCGEIGSPPPGVDTTPPELEPGRSQRFYSEERVGNPSCGGCHSQMEPLAWGLERFLADGTHSMEDHFGNELQEDGFLLIPGEGQAEYASVAELMELLATSEQVRDCVAEKSTQFAIGRKLEDFDVCTTEAIFAEFAASQTTYADLLVAIALSPGFRAIRTETE